MPLKRLFLSLLVVIVLTGLVIALLHSGLQGLLAGGIDFFQDQQRQFHDSLATDLHAIRDTGSWLPAFGLIGIGFLYGIFHAIGPGHGKLIVTSYMLANNSSLRRGIVIVVLSSLLQGVVAIVVVLGAFYLLGLARAVAEHVAAILESVSFGLIALVGAGLFLRGLREAGRLMRATYPDRHHDHHSHVHDHHNHDHPEHAHVHDAHCGHVHMSTPQEVERVHGFWPLALMIVSIGIRPCSGAIILLLFACLVGVIVPGILATLAMAVGTAVTTAALAVAAVQSKKFILRALQSGDRALAVTHAGLGIGGGLLVALLGVFFLIAGVELELQRQPDGQTGPNSQNAPAMPLMHLPPRPLN